MAKQLLKTIRPHVKLYRDPQTGIAWVEDGEAGVGHSCHPNIQAGPDNRGRFRAVYGRSGRMVKSHGWIYNTASVVVTDEMDEVARKHCHCGGTH